MMSIPSKITAQACGVVANSRRIQHSSSKLLALGSLPSTRHNLSTNANLRPATNLRASQVFASSPRCFHTSPPTLSAPKFTYGVAASYSAKDVRFNPRSHNFNFDPRAPIHRRRKDKRTRPASGQDAFFVSRVDKTDDIALGVADGVGGWADSGVDPADFSHGLCDYMAHTAFSYQPSAPPLSAQALMQKGYDSIIRDDTVFAGGSTACVGIAKGDGTLDIANLGDSGFVQLRLNAVHHYSTPQTHAFNTPYQLSLIPEHMRVKNAAFGGTQLEDSPKDAAVTKHDVRHGDVLVFATDGVWDNLSSSDILRVVSRLMVGSGAWEQSKEGIQVGERLAAYTDPASNEGSVSSLQSFLAVSIVGEAKAASMNTKVDGPFAKEVQRWYPEEDWRGGKVDDICVVVAVAVETGR